MCAGNWNEERSRLEAGETIAQELMAGARTRPAEPEVSIAPATRDPYQASTGRLIMPDRLRRSVLTNDSSRQGADDGFREYEPMTSTFFKPIDERPVCPISKEPNYHGTYGGPVQVDGREKTRLSAANRSKNSEEEPAVSAECDRTVSKKLLTPANLADHTFVARETMSAAAYSKRGGFGATLPRNPAPQIDERARLTSTHRRARDPRARERCARQIVRPWRVLNGHRGCARRNDFVNWGSTAASLS